MLTDMSATSVLCKSFLYWLYAIRICWRIEFGCVCFFWLPGQRPCENLSIVRRKLSHLNLLLWNQGVKIKQNLTGVVPFQNYISQSCPPFKMAVVAKNRNFFNCPLLLYYKSKWAQILTAATWLRVV